MSESADVPEGGIDQTQEDHYWVTLYVRRGPSGGLEAVTGTIEVAAIVDSILDSDVARTIMLARLTTWSTTINLKRARALEWRHDHATARAEHGYETHTCCLDKK